MKKLTTFLLLLITSLPVIASHISGGELFYEYLGPGSAPNTDKYKITMRLFRECNSNGAQLDGEVVIIGVYNSASLNLYTTLLLNQQFVGDPPTIKNTPGVIPCLINAPNICYQIGTYSNTIDLPKSVAGYTLSWVRYSRQYILNVNDNPYPTNSVGATFITNIPGTTLLSTGNNNSAKFVIKDTSIVCAGNPFTLDFGATDSVDHDSLSYSFCTAYDGGSIDLPNPPPSPHLSLISLPYASPYSGSSPLGSSVTINSSTGLISGTAPPVAGKYVVNVCVNEWRNGSVISTCRKDFILTVGSCDIPKAILDPGYVTCDGYTLQFQNKSTSPNINSYFWDFGVAGNNDTSIAPKPTYTFPDTGVYTIKLIVNKGQKCTDSTTAQVGIYPGFIANFNAIGSCYLSAFNFKDASTTAFGVVNSWHWNFGDLSTTADTSINQNDSYQYTTPNNYSVKLIVTNSKGCADTITKQVTALAKPVISLPFKDTLICKGDSLKLLSSVSGLSPIYKWTPSVSINNPNIANPIVFPTDTVTYFLNVNEGGCTSDDSIRVNVIPFISVFAGNDTTICRGDTIILSAVTNGLNFLWNPASSLNDASLKNPLAFPTNTTTYSLVSNVGKCSAVSAVTVKVVPYPSALATGDSSICYGFTAPLHATISGSSFSWSPTNSLQNPNSLNPIAGPQSTTTYIITVHDTLGCPKPFNDSVTVIVIPPIKAFAGHDTSIVINQPLQLNATGGNIYSWSPTIWMDNPNISNPIIIVPHAPDTIIYKVKVSVAEGCFAYDDIKITVFETLPDLFIPSAFTPNGDGRNDNIKPIAAGIKNLRYFKIFNRWGQLMFSTSELGKGWDGNVSGKQQPSGTYVYEAKAEDYQGHFIFKKGTIVLIR